MLTVTPEQLVSDSSLVFVGVPVARGGSEEVSPADPSEPIAALTAHRVRFDVTAILRGDPEVAIDLTLLDVDPDYDRFEIGSRYLIFAQRAELGTTKTPAIIPTGYYQGTFKFRDDRVARNSRNDEFDVVELAARLQRESSR